MALIAAESFGGSTSWGDFLQWGAWSYTHSSAPPTVNTGGPLGDNYMSGNNNIIGGVAWKLPSAYNTFFFGARLSAPPGGYFQNACLAFIDGSGTEQFRLILDHTTGVISIISGSTTLLTTNPMPLLLMPGEWTYLEVGATINAIAGSVALRFNGAYDPTLVVTGVNTKGSSGSNTVTGVVNGRGTFTNASEFSMAHLYFCDNTGPAPCNTFLGDCRVTAQNPTGNASVAFTPHGLASNWQNAAMSPPVPATDYNAATAVGAQDTFALSSVSGSTVFGVVAKALMGKTDVGGRAGAAVLVSGGTTVAGASTYVALTGTMLTVPAQTDPSTGLAWTAAGLSAATAGYRITA